MYSSLLIPPLPAESLVCMLRIFSQRSLAVFMKYEISALGCNPNTPGLVKRGIVSIAITNCSWLIACGIVYSAPEVEKKKV